ncbi:MAG: DUF3473 domain-containing protein [Planctomycetales bacterium]|nr:DUF3473 domain-containing protein [Planctomycetales bacterium]
MTLVNAFTVDVEDYFHVSAFESHIDRNDWECYPSRVDRNTRRILDLLAKHNVRGTFFVLGWIADRMPELVKEIQAAGHEIASHSYWHRLIYQLEPAAFQEDVRRSKELLEDITGQAITVFRAPSFSITKKSKWALEILAAEGFQIDTSIFPIFHDRYGIPGAPSEIHQVHTPSGSLWEFPPSVVRYGWWNLPVSGGGYFRLYPGKWTVKWLGRINTKERRPFAFYIHPWELDPDQPRLKVGSWVSQWRHYLNLSSTERKLTELLGQFSFGTVTEAITNQRRVCGEAATVKIPGRLEIEC